MADAFVQTTTKSWVSRIVNSFVGVFIGISLFFGSFVILFLNEGRVNLGNLVEKAPLLTGSQDISQELDGKLIALEGTVKTKISLGDTFLKPNLYLWLSRKVETYAWEEEIKTETHINAGGSEETQETYTYKKKWTTNPADSSEFKIKDGHTNYIPEVSSNIWTNTGIEMGGFKVSGSELSFPTGEKITLTNDNTVLPEGFSLANGYIYTPYGSGTLENPTIGDTRISYSGILSPLKNMTLLGQVSLGTKVISAYQTTEYGILFRLFKGNKLSAMGELRQQHTLWGRILRGVGLLCMFTGLNLIIVPVSVFFEILPFLGKISRGLLGVICFGVAFVLSSLTIIVSLIVHNIFALILILLLVGGAVVYYINKKGGFPILNTEKKLPPPPTNF